MPVYRFADFSLDVAAYELRCGEVVITIQPKVFTLLEYLLKNADRAISKNELLDEVWPDSVVGEAALTQAIRQARRAMGEEEGARIIRTVRGRGYRIGVDVQIELDRATRAPDGEAPDAPEETAEPLAADIEASIGAGPVEPMDATSAAALEASTDVTIDPEADGDAVAGAPAADPRRRRMRPILAALTLSLLASCTWLSLPRLEPPTRRLPISTGVHPPTSIAVLPFSDLSTAGDQEAFSNGLSEEILDSLSRVSGLRVVARRSAFQFKERDEDVRQIGAILSVGSIVEGTVRRTDERVRVTAQLVDTATGFQTWSETYDRPVDDIFALQQDLATSVVTAVRAELLDADALAALRRSQRNFDAYQLFLQARAASNLRTEASIREAIALCERAIAVDPGYADAHAALAYALILQWDYTSDEPRDGPLLARAEASARRAVDLDPENALGHAYVGNLLAIRDHDWSRAVSTFRRAIALNPGLATIRESFASTLMQMGRLDEAGEHLKLALDLDPLSPVVNRNVGRYHAYRGDAARAEDALWRSLELNPEDPQAPSLLWLTYTRSGREDEALDALVRLAPAPARPPLRVVSRTIGLRSTIAALLHVVGPFEQCPLGAHIAAQAYAHLGWKEPMLVCLDRALARDFGYTAVNPLFEPYRGDPAFREILARAGIDAD